MKYQDIHRSDAAFWSQYKQYIADGKYDEAASLIGEVDDKALIAEVFNYMTGQDGDYTKPNLKTLQENKSSTFKQDRIQVATEPPTGLESGQVYFQFNRVYHSEFPSKGDLIEIEGKQYRILKIDEFVAEVLAMYDYKSSIAFSYSNYDYQYSRSEIHKALNTDFYETLSDEIKNAIVEHDIVQYMYKYDYNAYNETIHASFADYSTKTAVDNPIEKCRVYALDIEDIEEYFNGVFSMSDISILFWNSSNFKYRDGPWFRSANSVITKPPKEYYIFTHIGENGIDINGSYYGSARPAFKINLSKISYTIVK